MVATRHADGLAPATVTRAVASPPIARTRASAAGPGCGSATPARPTGSSGESAKARATATPPPAAPMAAARPTPTAISSRRLMPIARSAAQSEASTKLNRTSTCPRTSTLIAPRMPASSHRATACRWIECSVFAACAASATLPGTLPPARRVISCCTAVTSAAPCRSRSAASGKVWASLRCARQKAGVVHTSPGPVSICGGNSAAAASIPTTRNTNATGGPCAGSSQTRSALPGPRCRAWASRNETLTSSGLPGFASRPATIFLIQRWPGIWLSSGASRVMPEAPETAICRT